MRAVQVQDAEPDGEFVSFFMDARGAVPRCETRLGAAVGRLMEGHATTLAATGRKDAVVAAARPTWPSATIVPWSARRAPPGHRPALASAPRPTFGLPLHMQLDPASVGHRRGCSPAGGWTPGNVIHFAAQRVLFTRPESALACRPGAARCGALHVHAGHRAAAGPGRAGGVAAASATLLIAVDLAGRRRG